MSNVNVYATSHVISKTICAAFAPGCNGRVVPAVTLLDGDVACYGILRGTHEILVQAQKENRDWYYIDLGYIGRSDHYHLKFDGYYRVSKKAYQCQGLGDYSSERWENLGISLQPWRRGGSHVLICPMSYNFSIHRGLDAKKWLNDTIAEVSRYTDRNILVKPKSSDMTLDEALMDCHAMIGYDTNAMVDAIIAGIPCFNLGPSAVAPVALQDLKQIESPVYPDRRQWAYNIAANQWTLNEFRNGTCWRMLQENADNNTPLVQRKRQRNVQ